MDIYITYVSQSKGKYSEIKKKKLQFDFLPYKASLESK